MTPRTDHREEVFMSPEIVAVLGVGVALAALILRLHTTLRDDVRELRRDQSDLRDRVSRLEGLLEGLRDAITGRRPAAEAD